MAELPEDTPEPEAGSGTPAADSPWLPPQLRQESAPPSSAPAPPFVPPGAGGPPPPVPPPYAGEQLVREPPPRARPRRLPRLRRRPGPRSSFSATAPAWIAAAVVALVVVGVVALVNRDAKDDKQTASSPVAIYRQLTTPFTVAGARFEVQPANDARWAAEMRDGRAERVGKRWVAVQVPVRNLSRVDLRPRGLGFRIVTPAGFVIGPEVVEVLPGSLDSQGRLAKGELSSVHLGFRVPNGARDLTVALDAGGIREPSVRVLLGAEG